MSTRVSELQRRILCAIKRYQLNVPGTGVIFLRRANVPVVLVWAELESWSLASDLDSTLRELVGRGLLSHQRDEPFRFTGVLVRGDGARVVIESGWALKPKGAWWRRISLVPQDKGGSVAEIDELLARYDGPPNVPYHVPFAKWAHQDFFVQGRPAWPDDTEDYYALTDKAFDALDSVATTTEARTPKRRGRRVDTNVLEDARIYDAWQTGAYITYAHQAAELGVETEHVKRAHDRERKRRRKANTPAAPE